MQYRGSKIGKCKTGIRRIWSSDRRFYIKKVLGAPSVDVRKSDLELQELDGDYREGYIFYVKQTNGECMSEAVKLVVVYMDIN